MSSVSPRIVRSETDLVGWLSSLYRHIEAAVFMTDDSRELVYLGFLLFKSAARVLTVALGRETALQTLRRLVDES